MFMYDKCSTNNATIYRIGGLKREQHQLNLVLKAFVLASSHSTTDISINQVVTNR